MSMQANTVTPMQCFAAIATAFHNIKGRDPHEHEIGALFAAARRWSAALERETKRFLH